MRLDDGGDYREAEARAARSARPRAVAAHEALEDRGDEARVDAGPAVDDLDDGVGVGRRQGRRDERARGRVGARVREEVGDDLVELGRVPLDEDGLVGEVERPRVLGAGRARVAHGVDEEAPEVDLEALEGVVLVEPGQEQQVFDERGHPHGLRLHAADRVGDVVGEVVVAPTRELGVPADGGERRAQLVARVGDEGAHLVLARLAGLERGCHVPEHVVERRAHGPHLRARVCVGVGHAHGEGHLAPVERQLGHPDRRRGDALEGPQRRAHDDDRHRGRTDHADEADARDEKAELQGGRVDVVERQADDEEVGVRAVARLARDDAEGAEVRPEVDRDGAGPGHDGEEGCEVLVRQRHGPAVGVEHRRVEDRVVADDGTEGALGLPGEGEEVEGRRARLVGPAHVVVVQRALRAVRR
mgnify:CR=1 FL=1